MASVPVMGLGLTRDAYYDWRGEWARLVAEHRADDVLVMVGPWDLAAVDRDPAGYAALLDEAAVALGAPRTVVHWVTPPPFERRDWDRSRRNLTAAIEGLASRNPHVRVVDGFAPLAVGGGYGRDRDGVRLRKDDGTHLCAGGAEAIAVAILAHLGVPDRGSWREAPWRTDPRYVVGLEGGACA